MATKEPTSEFDMISDRVEAALLKIAANRLLNPLKSIVNLLVPVYQFGEATIAQQSQVVTNMIAVAKFDVEQTAEDLLDYLGDSVLGEVIAPSFLDKLLDRLEKALRIVRLLKEADPKEKDDNVKILREVWEYVMTAIPEIREIMNQILDGTVTTQLGIKMLTRYLDGTEEPAVPGEPTLPWGQ